MNPYSANGSQYSNKSWTNPYATDAPKRYDGQGNYCGKLVPIRMTRLGFQPQRQIW